MAPLFKGIFEGAATKMLNSTAQNSALRRARQRQHIDAADQQVMNEKKHVKFQGRLVIIGFGSVGQGTLPLVLRHIDMPPERIRIVTGDTRGVEEAKHFGVKFTVKPLTRENYRSVLEPLISKGDFL